MTDEPRPVSPAARVAVPLLLGAAVVVVWQFLVWWLEVPKFVLPAPSLIVQSLVTDYASLLASLWITLRITLMAFLIALAAGVALAVLSVQSRLVEISIFPYAVIL
jgi:NitT/TauT family transport system permease protein